VCHYARLIRLCNVCEDDVDGGQEYPVFLREARILDDG
jgi:hypothetical protein